MNGGGDVGAAIIENQSSFCRCVKISVAVHDLDGMDDRADVAEFAAGVHADAAADGAGDAGQAFDAGQALADGAEEQLLHVGAGADFQLVFADLHAAEVIGIEAEDRAVDAGVADQEIGAQAQDVGADIRLRAAAGGFLEFFDGRGPDEPAGRAADAIPRVLRQRDVFLDDLFQAGKWVGEFQHDYRHILQAAVRSLPISQMFPAPMVTIRSSSRAFSFKYSTIRSERRQMHGLLAVGLDPLDEVGGGDAAVVRRRCRERNKCRARSSRRPGRSWRRNLPAETACGCAGAA